MNGLNETFSLILNEYQKTGNLETALKILNLSPTHKEKIQKAFQTLDAIEANARSLRAAKEEGISRKNWLGKQILATARNKNLSEKQTEETLSYIEKGLVKTANNINKEN